MRVTQPPFSNRKANLTWREKAELAPLVVPTVLFCIGIAIGFKAEAMPLFVPIGMVLAATAALIISLLPYIRLRNRLALSLRIVMTTLLILAVFGMGWFRAALRKADLPIPVGGTTAAYRAVVMQTSQRERSVQMDLVILDGTLRGHKIKATIWRDPNRAMPQTGYVLQAASFIEPLDIKDDAGWDGFNYHRWLFSHGFSGTTYISPYDWRSVQAHWGEFPRLTAVQLRALLLQQKLSGYLLSADGDNGAMAVATAMTLGDKQAIPKDVRQLYSITGAGHLLALSGWHLGLIYFLLVFFLPVRRHPFVSPLVATIAVWCYVLVVGMPVSAVRAAVMLTVYALADVSARGRQSLNTVALAALIILAVEPASLYDIGFQMSVAAVVGISLFYKTFVSMVYRRWFQPLALSLSAQIGVGPIVAYHFHTFSTYFLLTNLVAMPIAMIGVYAAALAIAAIPIGLLHSLFALVAQSACQCLNAALQFISMLPYSYIQTGKIGLLHVILLYIFLIFTVMAAYSTRNLARRYSRYRSIATTGYPKKHHKEQQRELNPAFFSDEDDA